MWNCMRNVGADTPLHDSGCYLGELHWIGGIALLSCQCNAVLSGASVLYLVHRFVAMKPVTPLRALVGAGLKPVTPLLGENVGFSGVLGSQW